MERHLGLKVECKNRLSLFDESNSSLSRKCKLNDLIHLNCGMPPAVEMRDDFLSFSCDGFCGEKHRSEFEKQNSLDRETKESLFVKKHLNELKLSLIKRVHNVVEKGKSLDLNLSDDVILNMLRECLCETKCMDVIHSKL
ncbi:16 kDa protein [Drakaea virus A]|uniref:16 kDa protein n=1 Tax=Drakaea virus A TaxID=1647805 RepID=A0A0F7KL15_9VIRU|nr:16 kDa protein [Drakaea virus A]AKH39763.1 16 kDa protein [Drakaea virus A]